MAHEDARRLARRIGPLGVWTFHLDLAGAADERAFAREIEELGYRALWIPEATLSKEVFTHATLLLAASERLIVASGIANIWARDAVATANGARTLAEAFPGRFVLGLGVSTEPAVRYRGGRYERPLARMRGYLDAIDAARSVAPAPREPAPRVLAALGPRMLRLAAERAAGAHSYFVPIEHTPVARRELGPGPLLAVEQAAVLERDAAIAREAARAHMKTYLGAESYVNNLRRLGWGDSDLGNRGSDALVDALVAWGDLATLKRRVESHLEAGADHVCVQMLETPTKKVSDQFREAAALVPTLT